MTRIRELRRERQMTQVQFAKICSISQATLSGYETGTFEPDLKTLAFMADYFGVTTDYLLGRTELRGNETVGDKAEAFAFALYGEAHDLSDDERKDVLDFIRFKKSQRR